MAEKQASDVWKADKSLGGVNDISAAERHGSQVTLHRIQLPGGGEGCQKTT